MAESAGERFWTAVSAALDPGSYKPRRIGHVEVARLRSEGEPYYVLKQPQTKQYLRLSERDYALWWQMDGRKTVKDLLLYHLRRYRSLPVTHINRLITDLRNGRFLQDTPTHLYDQLGKALAARSPENQGRRLLRGFLHSELALNNLDPFFTNLYRWFGWLFAKPVQWFLLLLILVGGLFYGRAFFTTDVRLLSGGLSLLTLLLANFGIIFIHELAHGLAVKRVGRELNRGGFLIYWGLPAFFVDTRDTWLSTRKERILVSWAGPHSGLLIGALAGFGLAYLSIVIPDLAASFLAVLLLQIGFIAYLTVFFNLNPLLELDGYFILMDWLDMPGLRQRAFRFWRQDAWLRWQTIRQKAPEMNRGQLFASPRLFWQSLTRSERIFAFFGLLAFLYSAYALWFAFYFWQSRLLPLAQRLWRDGGWWGHALLLVLATAVIFPTTYALLRYSWGQLRAALAWLARRDLLARSDVLALLIGIPLLIGLPALLFTLTLLPAASLSIYLIIWLVHLAALVALAGVARQLAGSRFQWSIWSLFIAFAGVTFAWVSPANSIWREGGLVVAAAGVLAASQVAWFTLRPDNLAGPERLLMGGFFLLGIGYLVGLVWLGENGRSLPLIPILLTLMFLFPGLIFFTPLLFNFWRSRFGLPWFLLVMGCLLIPWLHLFPGLHLPTAVLWLYAALLYLLLGALAQFSRADIPPADAELFDDRKRLVDAFNHFMQAFFASYELVFGRRRLEQIYLEIIALGPIEPDAAILSIAERARRGLLLAVDRLDDLAGTRFTHRAGQAAYDSLPWLEAEMLARHVLSETAWGSGLAAGFIRKRDQRRILLREADIFAGLDAAGLEELVAVARVVNGRSGQTLVHAGRDAVTFYLIETGQVGVFKDGAQVAVMEPGGYFGIPALQETGRYRATYRALTAVTLLAIDRDRLNPLFRIDSNLATKINSGAQSRRLLGRLPLFSSLSPQQLAMLDARLRHRIVAAGEQIVRQGQTRSDLIIVASGELLVLEEGEGGEREIGRLGPGEHFGEYALFADLPYLASLRAAVTSELYLLDEATFDRVTADCERLSHYVEQVGSGRLLAMRRRLDYTAILS